MNAKKVSQYQLKAYLAKYPSVKYVRLNWVDYSGILRTRTVTIAFALAQLRSDGSLIGLPSGIFHVPIGCSPLEGTSSVGELRLVPDFAKLYLHPHRNEETKEQEIASAMCDFYN